jgi:hypothetical protein
MSPFLRSYLNRRKSADESEPPRDLDSSPHDSDSRRDDDGVFDMVPPPLPEEPTADPVALAQEPLPPDDLPPQELLPEEPAYKPQPSGRGVHPIGITDLSRLAIDNEGRLYWDGKPVEVRRRVTMSRAQIVGAAIVAVFVVIGAVGAALNGSAAALDWACRLGWTTNYCATPDTAPPRPDLPA